VRPRSRNLYTLRSGTLRAARKFNAVNGVANSRSDSELGVGGPGAVEVHQSDRDMAGLEEEHCQREEMTARVSEKPQSALCERKKNWEIEQGSRPHPAFLAPDTTLTCRCDPKIPGMGALQSRLPLGHTAEPSRRWVPESARWRLPHCYWTSSLQNASNLQESEATSSLRHSQSYLTAFVVFRASWELKLSKCGVKF